MSSPQSDKLDKQSLAGAQAVSPAGNSVHSHCEGSWFVQSRALDQAVLDEWAELYACHAELPFYLHPDWLRSCNQSLFEETLFIISVFCAAADGDVDAASAANSVNAANRSHWLPSVMFAVRDSSSTSLCNPMHDHLTLGDLLIHPSLGAADITGAIAAVLQSDFASRLEFGNLPDSSMLMRAVLGARSPLAEIIADERAEKSRDKSGDTNLWVTSAVRETAWFDLDTETSVPSGKLRRNLNRLERKLKEKGEVEFKFTSGDEAGEAYHRFLQVETSGWKGSSGTETAILGNTELEQFYASLLTPQYEQLKVSINELQVNGQLVASQFSLCTGRDWYILKIAYDESYADYSPGSLLLHALITHARKTGIQRLSLVTNPPWADRWHPQTETVWRLVRHASPLLALGQKTFNGIKNQVRQVQKRVR